MTHEEIAMNLSDITIGLDDTFQFHCLRCGKCCTYRDDILLSPYDIFRISKAQNMTPTKFYETYCRSHIGDETRIPLVRLKTVGSDERCPLLKKGKCSVHAVKPAVCALFPLGRYLEGAEGSTRDHYTLKPQIKYLLQPPECGDHRETHTVREWIKSFHSPEEDHIFIRWQEVIADVSCKIYTVQKYVSPLDMMSIWSFARLRLYLHYDTSRAFLPQFEANYAAVLEMLAETKAERSYH